MSGIVGKSPFLNSNAVGKGLIGQVIQVVTDEKLIITKNLFQDNLIKLSLGKKRHIKVKII